MSTGKVVTLKLLLPMTYAPDEKLRFECQDPECGDIVLSSRVSKHGLEVHKTRDVSVDTTAMKEFGTTNSAPAKLHIVE